MLRNGIPLVRQKLTFEVSIVIIKEHKGVYAMTKQQFSIMIDEKLKTETEAIFERLGLDMPTAINIFLHKVVAEGGIPFSMTLPGEPTQETLSTKHLENDDGKWLEEVPISPYPINRSRLADMINMVYYYTHNIGKKIVSHNDVWKVFRDGGFITYDSVSESKCILSEEGAKMLELKNSKNFLIKEQGQRYFIAHIQADLQSKAKKKKRNKNE